MAFTSIKTFNTGLPDIFSCTGIATFGLSP